jgi:ABC-2 type transport system ATP-binding protein
MIEVRGLRVDYEEVCAVRDLTLSIGRGEVYGLIGPNGAGKTSALRVMAGIAEPTLGAIQIGGIDLFTRREEALRLLGFMPDFSPLYDELTVYEFLDLFAVSYLLPRAARPGAISRALERVGLAERRDSLTAELSLGMKRRLTLAKTLLPDPQVLLLDEPAAGMDPHGRALLKEIVRDLGRQGRTVIVSSHILSELSEFCTSVGILTRGELVASGRIGELAAQVVGGARYAVEVVTGEERLERLLAAEERVSALRRRGASFEFCLRGDPAAASDLLARLVGAGARVASFSRKDSDLEALFLSVSGEAGLGDE